MMAAPYWVSVAVLVLMTVTNGETVIDPNQLAPIVQDILNRYTPSYIGANNNRKFPMFSVAVSVPYNEQTNTFDMNGVTDDDGEKVKKDILDCDVYQGDRVVAATVLRWPNVLTQCPNARVQWTDVLRKCRKQDMTWNDVKLCRNINMRNGRADHAEFRTLQHVNTLVKSENDLMVFYIRASPCDQRCTNQDNRLNILTNIKKIWGWKNYVVVFSDVFRPRDGGNIPENNLRESLKRLGNAIADQGSNGLQHIFRCYRQQEMKCFSCDDVTDGDTDGVTDQCVSDRKQPDRKLSDVGKSPERGEKQNQSKNVGKSPERGERQNQSKNVRKGQQRGKRQNQSKNVRKGQQRGKRQNQSKNVRKGQQRGKRQNQSKKKQKGNIQRGVMRENHQN
uniref:uncharacterized protein LOC112435048 n=1 Tax=Maylandia zebra TaxID=106582 RepID=UPI000D307E66|nr:uncharacterized protein LOC112435048 [Maylandia zebra]